MRRDKSIWHKIKAEYLLGKKSVELSKKYGKSKHAIEKRCAREAWKGSKVMVGEKAKAAAEAAVVNAVEYQVTKFVSSTLARGQVYQEKIDAELAKSTDAPTLDVLSRTDVRVVGMMRQAYGLPDAPQRVQLDANVMIQVIDPYSVSELVEIPGSEAEDGTED